MKIIIALTLLTLLWLQSCTQKELVDTAPKPDGTDSAVVVQNIVSQFSEDFYLDFARVLYLKPVDNDPATNLTTVYSYNDDGSLKPLINDFEVQQLESTNRGVYVKTNYFYYGLPIVFFLNANNTWINLTGVGEYMQKTNNGDILFRDGNILRAESMQVEKLFNPTTTTIINVSGNLLYVHLTETDTYRVINTATKVYHDVEMPTGQATDMSALLENEMALIQNDNNLIMLNMRNGVSSVVEGIVNPRDLGVRGDNAILVVSEDEATDEHGTPLLIQTFVTFSFTGDVITFESSGESPWDEETSEPVKTDYVSLLKPYIDHIVDYEVVGHRMGQLIYYTGTLNGKPVTGYYISGLNSNQVIVNDVFTSVNILEFPFEEL